MIAGVFSDWWNDLFGDGDPKAVKKILQDYDNYLQYQDVFSLIGNTIIWGLIRGLYKLNSILEQTIYQSFELKDILNAAGLNALYISLINKVLAILCVVTLMYIGIKFATSKHPPKFKNVLINLFLGMILIFGSSSLIDEGLNISKNFYGDMASVSQHDKSSSPSFQIIQNNVTDISVILSNDANKIENIPIDKRNALTSKNFKIANINSVITPADAKDMAKSEKIDEIQKERLNALQYRLELDDSGTEIPVEIQDEGLAKMAYTSGYRRYSSKPGIIFAGQASLTLAYLFMLFTIVSCIIELGFKKFYLVITGATDFETGQRMKTAIEDVANSFLLLAFTILELRIYTLMLSGIGDLYAADKLNGFLYVIGLIALTIALFKGSQTVTKIFGVDTSLKNGGNSLMSMFALGSIMKNAGKGVKNIGNAGKEGLSNLNNIRKNGFTKRKNVTPSEETNDSSGNEDMNTPKSEKTVSDVFGKNSLKNGLTKAAEGLGYMKERGVKETGNDVKEKAKEKASDAIKEKLEGTRAEKIANTIKNPADVLNNQKEKASDFTNEVKDAYSEGEVSAALKNNETKEKPKEKNQQKPTPPIISEDRSEKRIPELPKRTTESDENQIVLPKDGSGSESQKPSKEENQNQVKKHISDLPETTTEAAGNQTLPKNDPDSQSRKSTNTANKNQTEKHISDLPGAKVEKEAAGVGLPKNSANAAPNSMVKGDKSENYVSDLNRSNDSKSFEVNSDSTRIDLPKQKTGKISYKENKSTFTRGGTQNISIKDSQRSEGGNETLVSYSLQESVEPTQTLVSRETAPKPITKTHSGYRPANVAFSSPSKIEVTKGTKEKNNVLKEQLLKDIKK